MKKSLFNYVKTIVPKISQTELTALRSGTTCIDRQIFNGKVSLPVSTPKPFDKTNLFNHKIDDLLKLHGNDKIYPNPHYKEIIDYIKTNRFFSFIINEKYGGANLSVKDQSSLLTKITSKNPALGVTVMVPNSLGPAELLAHYGTLRQKQEYLPGLADGTYVPCFGLTGPHNGSDAAGLIDEGVVEVIDGKRYIHACINKRYITLAPVSNLIGLAFKLKDPNNLLEKGQEGITVALIKDNHPGLIKKTHHNPLDVGFPNGTLKGDIYIDLDQIIGGEQNAGNGWKMLMECLAAGRAVSLPATALASSKVSCYGIFNYAKHRTQFNIPLIKMEGVNQKILDIFYNTWVIQSSVHFTNSLLDSGEKPAVLSAVMKQQTTDRARDILNNAMDIHAGSAICVGYSNFLEKFYKSAPVGITVEGSNTLTKHLIIFGQGLNKSHPYIFPVFEGILENDIDKFYKNFKLILSHSLKLYAKSMCPMYSRLEKQTIDFACLSNFVALKGGAIKQEQYLSADMADIFSNLYLAYSVKWYHQQHGVSDKLTTYCIHRLLDENAAKFNRVINDSPFKMLLYHLKKNIYLESYLNKRSILDEIINNDNIIDFIKKDIYTKNTILEDLEKLNHIDRNSDQYKILYQKVINVTEYQNI